MVSTTSRKRLAQHAAHTLTGEWLSSLTWEIDSLRGRARALAKVFPTSAQLALVTAHVVTKRRDENKPPSVLTVAQEIGKLLGAVDDRAAEKIGGPLLGMAETCGFVWFADVAGKRAGWEAALEVRLTAPAEQQRADIEAQLAADDTLPARPLLERPPVEVHITPNYDDFNPTPPQPIGNAVDEALAPIQNTAWRVNQFMLETLLRLKRLGWLALDDDNLTAAVAAIVQAKRLAVGAPEFWYRCNFDWRGRLYQQGGRLQYTSGADVARSLLEFAHGEPLTPGGYAYLSAHVATCYGVRGSLTDRASWAHGNADAIVRAAADPISTRFWRRAKEPYRFLSACRAWADVAANRQALIYLPVTADATASAFQHYAWLLRDEDLAHKVNLAPVPIGTEPQDLYSDAARGYFPRAEMKEQAWIVYGKKARRRREYDIQDLVTYHAPSAWALQLALQEEAAWKAKAGQPIEWTLPDGFRVRQANCQSVTAPTAIWLHSRGGAWRLQPRRREVLEALDAKEQAKGLPANLVHSLDACLLRSIVREAAGVSRWAVAHDSLGVHPNDGDRLRDAIVEAIECVYGGDVLAGLVDAWQCPPDAPLALVTRFARAGQSGALPATMRGGWGTFS